MTPRVVIVGSFVQDLCFNCEHFPAPGETTLGRFFTGPGGKGSNQAVAAARLGAAVTFIGAVGDDAFAAGARAFHRREGIRSILIPKRGHATAAATVLVDATGQNEIVVALGASARIQPLDIPPAALRGARIVVCQHEANPRINAHVFRLARKQGVTTVLNPAPMRGDFAPAILRHTDILIPNETEFVQLSRALKLSRSLDEAALAKLDLVALQKLCRGFGVSSVIVTLGSRGCFVSLADRGELVPAFKVKPVDTTGAGDAFVGGFVAALARNPTDVIAAARQANAVAALSVTKPGTSPSMPTAKELARFLKTRA